MLCMFLFFELTNCVIMVYVMEFLQGGWGGAGKENYSLSIVTEF